jgi:hemerythrin
VIHPAQAASRPARDDAWERPPSVGVPEFDADHAEILAIARELRDALRLGSAPETVQELLDELLERTLAHFEREERVLIDTAYPLLAEHLVSHNRLLRALLHFKEDVRHRRYQPELAIKFIHTWVVEHVIVDDSRYGEHLQAAAAQPGDKR